MHWSDTGFVLVSSRDCEEGLHSGNSSILCQWTGGIRHVEREKPREFLSTFASCWDETNRKIRVGLQNGHNYAPKFEDQHNQANNYTLKHSDGYYWLPTWISGMKYNPEMKNTTVGDFFFCPNSWGRKTHTFDPDLEAGRYTFILDHTSAGSLHKDIKRKLLLFAYLPSPC